MFGRIIAAGLILLATAPIPKVDYSSLERPSKGNFTYYVAPDPDIKNGYVALKLTNFGPERNPGGKNGNDLLGARVYRGRATPEAIERVEAAPDSKGAYMALVANWGFDGPFYGYCQDAGANGIIPGEVRATETGAKISDGCSGNGTDSEGGWVSLKDTTVANDWLRRAVGAAKPNK